MGPDGQELGFSKAHAEAYADAELQLHVILDVMCDDGVEGGAFTPDVPGDYELARRGGATWRRGGATFRAMALPPKMGQSPRLRFSDSFRANQTGDARGSFNTDSLAAGWTALGAARVSERRVRKSASIN